MNSDLPDHAQPDTHSTSSVTIPKMMAEQVKPDHFPSTSSIEFKLDALLKEYTSQFLKDETP